jgi:protein O-GlcNAc transferase
VRPSPSDQPPSLAPPSLARAKALQLEGRVEAAEAGYRALLEAGDAAEALQGLGLARFQRGDLAGAVDLLRACLALKADPRAAYNLAVVLAALGRPAEAAEPLRALADDAPDYLPPLLLLSTVLEQAGDAAGAAAAAVLLLTRATTLGEPSFIRAAVERVLALGCDPPDLVDTANRLRTRGAPDQARQLLQARLGRAPDDLGARLALAMSRLAIVHTSEDDIASRRQAYARDLDQLAARVEAASPQALRQGAQAVGDTKPFFLAYQGGDDRALQQTYGQAITRLMAEATRDLAPPPPARPRANGRLRVGFACGYFHTHSVSKLFGGWIRHLDRRRFEVFGYDLSQSEDDFARGLAASCDHFSRGFRHHQHAFEVIAADGLDVLIYPEIGMHPIAVQLACRRLAPVQCVTWGHPVTSGLPNIDYFLSSDLMEPADGQDAYTERLVRLPNLSICYEPVGGGGREPTRAELGLREDAVVYVCCQSLFKYPPRHDDLYPAIAARVADAQFLFIGDVSDTVANAAHARFSAAFARAGLDPGRFLVFTPPVPGPDFAGLLRQGDVYLDSIGWSGCNTTLEAVACDLPVVTLPTGAMRGRHSAAILAMMGLEAYVAPTREAYVDLAAGLAEPGARAAARRQVADNKHRLFGDLAPVRALEEALVRAVDEASARLAG